MAIKPKTMVKKGMFKFGGSSEEHGSLSVASDSPSHDLFDNNLTNTDPSTSSAVIEEDEESCQDDRAIDNDTNDWEDLNEEENSENSVDEKMFFQRIQLRVNPPPKRESLITLAIQSAQNYPRPPQPVRMVPRSTFLDVHRVRTPFSSMKVSQGESDVAPIRIRRKPSGARRQSPNDVVRSSAQPIPLTTHGSNEPVVLSPRTTRRNMIAHEFTEPLYRNLLWERKQKTLTSNAVLKRRYTYEDVANLDQCPQRYHVTKDNNTVDACSWDQDFISEAFAGYHTKGW